MIKLLIVILATDSSAVQPHGIPAARRQGPTTVMLNV